jgi:hypothetical protein
VLATNVNQCPSMKTAAVPEKLVLSPFTSNRAKAERWLKAGTGGTDGVIAKHSDGIDAAAERAMVKVKLLRTADCVAGGAMKTTVGLSARYCLGSTIPRAPALHPGARAAGAQSAAESGNRCGASITSPAAGFATGLS